METDGKDPDGESPDRRDDTVKAEQRDSVDVLAVSDDQEDTWNDESRRERLAKASTNNKIHHHCSVGCATHRMSHRKPNLAQTMSGTDFRKLFTAAPGMVMVGADLAGIELRILAHYLARHDEGRYAKILLEDDIHQVNADAIGVSRKLVKNITYGFMYGASDRKLGEIYDSKLAKSKQVKKGKEIELHMWRLLMEWTSCWPALQNVLKTALSKRLTVENFLLDSDHKALNFLLQGVPPASRSIGC